MDWTGCNFVESNPLKLHGKPIVKGTRMDADGLLENYEDGMSVDDVSTTDELGWSRLANCSKRLRQSLLTS